MVRTNITASTANDEEEVSPVSPDVVFTVVMESVVFVLKSDVGKNISSVRPFLPSFLGPILFNPYLIAGK